MKKKEIGDMQEDIQFKEEPVEEEIKVVDPDVIKSREKALQEKIRR